MGYIENPRRVACPHCGAEAVRVRIRTTLTFTSEHPVYENGIDMGESDQLSDIIGGGDDFSPYMSIASYGCESCGKKWFKSDYELVYDDNENKEKAHFVKVEQRKRKSKKKIGKLF